MDEMSQNSLLFQVLDTASTLPVISTKKKKKELHSTEKLIEKKKTKSNPFSLVLVLVRVLCSCLDSQIRHLLISC